MEDIFSDIRSCVLTEEKWLKDPEFFLTPGDWLGKK
jgi:hypothetical protein